ncbi:MAG: SDR family oxidoreductase [Gammaproteobacteria bacterium]|nr:SDR family oxidoreductase [Gammaproteobacteria bacterium]
MTSTNRSALITGSGRNIGRAIALELASRGFNIVLNGSSDTQACQAVADEVSSLGVQAVIAMGDIGQRDQVQSIAQCALESFGTVDVLINNAAIRPNYDFVEDSEEEWERVMNTNFKSCYWLARACLPGMLEQGWGRIVFFTGMNAQQGYPGKSAVSVSKHAAWGLTKSLSKDYGPRGITSNIISPGTIVGETENPTFAEKYDALKKINPSGRLGVPTDIASTVGFLASDEAGFINGQIMQINGGVVG